MCDRGLGVILQRIKTSCTDVNDASQIAQVILDRNHYHHDVKNGSHEVTDIVQCVQHDKAVTDGKAGNDTWPDYHYVYTYYEADGGDVAQNPPPMIALNPKILFQALAYPSHFAPRDSSERWPTSILPEIVERLKGPRPTGISDEDAPKLPSGTGQLCAIATWSGLILTEYPTINDFTRDYYEHLIVRTQMGWFAASVTRQHSSTHLVRHQSNAKHDAEAPLAPLSALRHRFLPSAWQAEPSFDPSISKGTTDDLNVLLDVAGFDQQLQLATNSLETAEAAAAAESDRRSQQIAMLIEATLATFVLLSAGAVFYSYPLWIAPTWSAPVLTVPIVAVWWLSWRRFRLESPHKRVRRR